VPTRLFGGKRREEAARGLYAGIVAQARRPDFYSACGVPDTLDGRFELVALHAFLVLHRLKRDRGASAELAQSLFDVLFLDMDVSLRELGVGDLGVGRRVKAMAQGFYGRIAAYQAGLDQGEETLVEALRRNLYGTVEPAEGDLRAMAGYLRREAGGLAAQDLHDLAAGRVVFGAPPSAGTVPGATVPGAADPGAADPAGG
jgi:cytochrome b pre-mRNA-processing protein 3